MYGRSIMAVAVLFQQPLRASFPTSIPPFACCGRSGSEGLQDQADEPSGGSLLPLARTAGRHGLPIVLKPGQCVTTNYSLFVPSREVTSIRVQLPAS
jgi:hypothetical protein